MKKSFFAGLLAAVMMASSAMAAYAEVIGVVDYDKLIRSYNKAQSFNDDREIREQDLEKMRAEFVKQLREAKTAQSGNPVAVDQLEKKLQDQLNAKINETRDWMTNKGNEIEKEMTSSISSVATAKKLDVVMDKRFVFVGGTDITNDVLAKLNASPVKATPAK